MNKHNRTVVMYCPTCGGTQFRSAGDDTGGVVTCALCGRTLTRDELLRENSENIAGHVEEVKSEVAKDISKQLQDSLRKAFQGSKSIRIK